MIAFAGFFGVPVDAFAGNEALGVKLGVRVNPKPKQFFDGWCLQNV